MAAQELNMTSGDFIPGESFLDTTDFADTGVRSAAESVIVIRSPQYPWSRATDMLTKVMARRAFLSGSNQTVSLESQYNEMMITCHEAAHTVIKMAYQYNSAERRLRPENPNAIRWKSGSPPLHRPICGLQNDLCVSSLRTTTLIASSVTCVAVVAVLTIVVQQM
ncbi:hypothetical protein RvY_04662 [Ramazzottius varieornatus]|uniref:Uncharacterized protein n=1 Tax=Ramazzottius varieornatus TaxID=947166 RepID=A0A1D1UVV4_RAMVA|nr:hypothetical protein RvY_04662 [Ramazzottius varieornatus]